ncbi:uncharacterized protein LOC133184800 [Saccostrea echinata]|uniref:uncharacterized protein LOC133184800 n=1 Tax=Saccostrea echinata TaxID=191078 RepID=UPI002A7EF48D|nr:uncharacterized protein LOC133184800 [Saccostrea echinata]
MLIYKQYVYTLLIILPLKLLDIEGASQTDYKQLDCRYHFHYHPLSWMEAYNVCEGNNQTLLKLDDPNEHTQFSSIVQSRINSILSTAVESMWIGLSATSKDGNLYHLWPDCTQLTSSVGFNPWPNPLEAQKEGCVMLNPALNTYSVNNCHSSLGYVCEETTADPAQCFYPMTDANNQKVFEVKEYFPIDESSCAQKCHEVVSPCAGVMGNPTTCSIFTTLLNAVNTPGRGTLYAHTLINWSQYSTVKSTVPPAEICSISPSTDIAMTSSAIFYSSSESVFSSVPSVDGSMQSMESSISQISSEISISSQSDVPMSSTATLYPSSESIFSTGVESLTQSLEPSITSQISSEMSISSTPALQSSVESIFSSPDILASSSSYCACPCRTVNNVTYTPEELQKKLEQMKAELTVEAKETNKYKRTLISVPDHRPSARGIGSLGILILCTIIILLVAFDFPRAAQHTLKLVKCAKEKLKHKN